MEFSALSRFYIDRSFAAPPTFLPGSLRLSVHISLSAQNPYHQKEEYELLKEVLNTGWEQQLVCDTTLYLIGVSREALIFPYSSPDVFQIGSLTVQRNLLYSKDELLHELHEDGDCYSTLASLSARYVDLFKNELHWHYPSRTTGTPVCTSFWYRRVLCLPYDYVT